MHIDADRILILDIGQDALIQQASDLLMKHGILQQPIQVDDSELSLLRDKLRRRQVLDKLAVLMNVDYGAAAALVILAPTSLVEQVE